MRFNSSSGQNPAWACAGAGCNIRIQISKFKIQILKFSERYSCCIASIMIHQIIMSLSKHTHCHLNVSIAFYTSLKIVYGPLLRNLLAKWCGAVKFNSCQLVNYLSKNESYLRKSLVCTDSSSLITSLPNMFKMSIYKGVGQFYHI